MIEFTFKLASISISLVTIIFAIILGIGNKWSMNENGTFLVFLLLCYIAFIITFWIIVWLIKHTHFENKSDKKVSKNVDAIKIKLKRKRKRKNK